MFVIYFCFLFQIHRSPVLPALYDDGVQFNLTFIFWAQQYCKCVKEIRCSCHFNSNDASLASFCFELTM